MASRGLWRLMSARTRRTLTVSWTALFILSLLMQYFAFTVAAPATLAVHDEGLFELDGNTVNNPAVTGDDWDSHPGATGNRFLFITDGFGAGDNIFTTGGSKDDLNTTSWKWTTGSVQDKNDIEHAYAASYEKNGHTFVYFGLDRFSNNGDAFTGFWFFKNGISANANGTFSPAHTVGDLLVQADFTNGGAASTIKLYEWVGSGGDTNGTLDLLATGQVCTAAPADDKACAVTNSASIDPSWTFDDKGVAGSDNLIPPESFFEGGIDLDDLFGGNAPCFSSFLAETRSSQSVDSTLSDFATGAFNTCVPPTLTTQVSASTVDFGGTVTDTATLSGNDGPASGTVTFFVCKPSELTGGECPSGGTQVGSAVNVTTSANGGTATSSAYTVGLTAADAGKYCWRAVYTPDAASQYLTATHTNSTTECFTVNPATIDITKVANPAGPVSAGDPIGFDITVTNTGTGTALNVVVNDPLPAGIVWSAGAVTGPNGAGVTCSIDTAPSPDVLSCTDASLPAGGSWSVHISGTTDAADCGTVSNTAGVQTSNDGSDTATASVVVQCPDVTVAKTPDGGTVNAGGTAQFTIVVTNLGPGTATNVTLTDNLPAGVDWSEDSASCTITGAVGSEVLNCNFGTLASGASATVHVSGLTDAADCGVIPNTATVAASNEAPAQGGNNSDNGSIEVLCAQIVIDKTANPAGPVSAGDPIGFDATVSNNGNGAATDVHVSDPLPAGIDWSLGAITGDTAGVTCQITGSVGSEALTCDDASMAAGDSFTVHVSGVTDAADCGTVTNTATVSTGNDGTDSDDASVTVQCPDVLVLKTADNSPISAGEPAAFTITVSNAGPGAASNVHVSDPLPAGVAWTINPAVTGCAIAAGTLTCDFPTLAAGASVVIHVSGVTDGADCGNLPNTVTVSASNEPASAAGNNTATATVVVFCPDVTVVKSADNSPINAGDTAAFTITVTNLGPGTAYEVHVADVLPAGVAWTIDPAVPGCAIAAGTLTCDFSPLLDDQSIVIHVSGVTDAADCGNLPNTVTVSAINEPASAAGNNSDDATIVVNCPDVAVEKTPDVTPISAGQNAAFTISVTNLGPGLASNVVLDDTLPAGVAWSVALVELNGNAIANPCDAIVGTALHCDLGDMANGDVIEIHIGGETDADDCGTLHNEVTIGADNEPASAGGNNSDEADIVVDCPDLLITKTADHTSPVVAGNEIGFVITITNNGAGTAFDVTSSDTLPAGFSWSIASQSGGWTLAGNDLSFGPQDLASGASATVHVVSDTDFEDCGSVPNTAFLFQVINEQEVPAGNEEDSASEAVRCPEIDLTKSSDDADGIVDVGQTVTFTILASVAEGPVTNAVITDVLPAGQTYVAGSQTSNPAATFAQNGQTLTWTYPSLNDGDPAVTITYQVTIDASAAGDLTNVAELCVSEVPNCESDDETVTPQPELAIEKSNDAPLQVIDLGNGTTASVPTAKEGSTVTYTLHYTVESAVTNAVITDVLPVGVTYVTGSASSDAQFTFTSFDMGTRTLRWDAPSVTVDGTLSYKATIDDGASELDQPLVNVATIRSDQTPPDSDDSPVFVPEPVLELTPPPTDTLGPSTVQSNPGFALMLVLIGLAGFALALGFITPVPERVRRRDRLG